MTETTVHNHNGVIIAIEAETLSATLTYGDHSIDIARPGMTQDAFKLFCENWASVWRLRLDEVRAAEDDLNTKKLMRDIHIQTATL